MFTTTFKNTNMFWHQCQDNVVRIERKNERDTKTLSVGVGMV